MRNRTSRARSPISVEWNIPNVATAHVLNSRSTRDVFYVRREVDLMKTAKVNAYIMHIFGKIELLSLHATLNYFKIHYFNAF